METLVSLKDYKKKRLFQEDNLKKYDSLYETIKARIINFYQEYFCGSSREIDGRISLHLDLLKEKYFLKDFKRLNKNERALFLEELHQKTNEIYSIFIN